MTHEEEIIITPHEEEYISSDFESDEEFEQYFEEKKASMKKGSLRQWLFGKKYLGFCFLAPFALMALIYVAFGVWPVSEHSALVLDLNAQYVYYIEKFRAILSEGGSFLYTFERALGGEFMGIFAYYLASPFNLITLLFPKELMTEAVLTILLAKCGACGLTFGIFLHGTREKRRPVANLIFSTMYALSAFAVVMQSNLMWTDNLICFPLILLGIDRLIKYGKFKTYTVFLALAVFSNFYIGYMTCLFVAIYFFIRYFSMSKEERNPLRARLHFPKTLGRVLFFSIIAVMIAAVVILCAYYSLTFGKLEFSEPDYKAEQLFDFADLLSKFYFGSYDTVRPTGSPFLYAGMLMTLLAPLYFIAPSIPSRKKVGVGILMAIFVVSFNLTTADLIWHGFQRPNWLNARFAYMFVAIALVMAYEVLIRLSEIGYKKVVVSGGVSVLILAVLQKFELENMPDLLCVWASIGFILIYLIALRFTHVKTSRTYVTVTSVVLALIVSVEMFAAGVANVYALDDDVLYSTRESYRTFLDKCYSATEYVDENAEGFYREEKLEHRKTNDNFALGIKGLSNSTSTLNAGVIDLLNRLGFTSKSHWSKYVGGNILSDSFFGVKYIYVDKLEAAVPKYMLEHYDEILYTDEGITVYENPYALSVGFEVSDDIFVYYAEYEGYKTKNPFEYINDIYSMTSGIEDLQLFKPLTVTKTTNSGNRKFGVEQDHTGYERHSEDSNATITFKFTATGDDMIYMYVPSTWPREATYKVNGGYKGTYFTNDTHAVVEIGKYNKGDEITVEFTQKVEKFYYENGYDYFYTFDTELFEEVKDNLVKNQINVTTFEEDRLEGSITVENGAKTILTTIPYDEGWQVLCDGSPVEIDRALGSLLAFRLEEGEHVLEFKYMPDCYKYGMAITVSGIVLFILACTAKFYMPFVKKGVVLAVGSTKTAISKKISALKQKKEEEK